MNDGDKGEVVTQVRQRVKHQAQANRRHDVILLQSETTCLKNTGNTHPTSSNFDDVDFHSLQALLCNGGGYFNPCRKPI